MKKLFAVLLSLQMIIAPVAIAAEEASGSPGDQFRNGPVKKGADYMNQILGIANGVVGAQIIIHCQLAGMKPSLMAYMAGGIAYVAKEILGGKGQKAVLTASAENLKMLEEKMKGGDVQKAALEAALTDEKEKLKFVKNRKMWMMAITAIYLTATGLAVVELMRKPVDGDLPAGCTAKTGTNAPMTAAIAAAYSFISGGGLLGGAAAGAINYFKPNLFMAASGVEGSTGLLNTAEGRIGVFGASTLLSGMIMMGLSKREKILKENISKLEDAIANFKQETTGPGVTPGPNDPGPGTGPGEGDLNNPNGPGSTAIALLPDGIKTLPKNCLAKNLSTYSESSCGSSFRMSSPKLSGNANIPTLQTASQTAANMANALASGNVEAANVAAGGLAAMAGRLEDVKKNLAKQLNDQLKKQGKGPLDIDTLAKARLGAMQSSLANDPGMSNALANMKDDAGDSKLDALAKIAPQTPKPIAASPSIKVPTADGSAITEGALAEPPADVKPEVADMNQDFEYNENDVSEKQDVSIFQQVTNRYILNYPKLFSRNEPKPEESAKK